MMTALRMLKDEDKPLHVADRMAAAIEITGKWETIAVVKSINHVAIAEFIVALANEHNQTSTQMTVKRYAKS
jgi:hypothetical protein